VLESGQFLTVLRLVLLAALLTFGVGCSSGPSPDGDEVGTRSRGPRVVHYEVSLEVERVGDAAVVSGEAVLRVAADEAGVLVLDAVGFETLEVVSDAEVAWSYDGKRMEFELARPPAGETRITIRYEATPTRGVTVTDGGIWTAFHSWHWMPCTIDPDERATVELTVTGPPGWTVLATGDGPRGPGADHATVMPYPSYLYGFAMGPFERAERADADGVSIEVWAPSTTAAVDGIAARTVAALARWRSRFGDPWALDRYVQVLVPGRAAQELAGMAFLSVGYADEFARDPEEDWLIVHELAHQAWGNQVTCESWGDFWINEAFAVWWVARDKALRGDREGYERELRLWSERVERGLARGDDPRIRRPGATVDTAGGTIVYHAGARFVEELAATVGVATLESTMARLMREARERGGLGLSTPALLDALAVDPDERAWADRRLAGS
jgi:aminopeptidase N